MRAISEATQARLDDEAATFCHCWKLVRRDGVAQGFTNHDVDLAFDGVRYEADAGLDAATMEAERGDSSTRLSSPKCSPSDSDATFTPSTSTSKRPCTTT